MWIRARLILGLGTPARHLSCSRTYTPSAQKIYELIKIGSVFDYSWSGLLNLRDWNGHVVPRIPARFSDWQWPWPGINHIPSRTSTLPESARCNLQCLKQSIHSKGRRIWSDQKRPSTNQISKPRNQHMDGNIFCVLVCPCGDHTNAKCHFTIKLVNGVR